MCEPVTILTTLAIASTAAGLITEHRAAKNQKAAITQAFESQQKEITQTQVADINERQRQARKEQARIRVAAGQAGLQLSGSVQGLLTDSAMQTTLFSERTGMNADTRREASTQEANSMFSKVDDPSVLGAGLRLASAGASAFYTGQGLSIQRAAAAKGPSV